MLLSFVIRLFGLGRLIIVIWMLQSFILSKSLVPSYLRMELIRLESGSDDAIHMFEYNSHPPDEVQNLWFTTWVNHTKLEFDLKVAQFGRKPETIQKLAGLFKESHQVTDIISTM